MNSNLRSGHPEVDHSALVSRRANRLSVMPRTQSSRALKSVDISDSVKVSAMRNSTSPNALPSCAVFACLYSTAFST